MIELNRVQHRAIGDLVADEMIVLCGYDKLAIVLIPLHLNWLCLHFDAAHLYKSQSVDYDDAGVGSSSKAAGNKLSTVAIYNLRAPTDRKLRVEFELCQQHTVNLDAILKSQHERVAIGVYR